MLIMDDRIQSASGIIKGHIRIADKIPAEPLLYIFLPVPGADHEFIEAVIGIFLHYVPEYGLAAYLYHWFRAVLALLRYPCAFPARKKYYLHNPVNPHPQS